MQAGLAIPYVICLLLLASCYPPGDWSSGISLSQARAWEAAGLGAPEANAWTSIGVSDPQTAAAWQSLLTSDGVRPSQVITHDLPGTGGAEMETVYSADLLRRDVVPLINAGITPAQASQVLGTGADLSLQRPAQILNAVSIMKTGATAAEAAAAAAKGLDPAHYAAAAAAKRVAAERGNAIVREKCQGGSVGPWYAVFTASPYAVAGRCFVAYGYTWLPVCQWLSPTEFLARGCTIDIRLKTAPTDLLALTWRTFVVRGGAAFVYTTVLGARRAIPSVTVIWQQ